MASCGWHIGLLFRRTILLILVIPIANAQPQSLSFDYPTFNSTQVKQLKLEGNAFTSGSAIQLTRNTMDPINNGSGTVGRVTYPEQIDLWDNNSNEPKDFTTNFSFVVSSNDQSHYGDGLAFFLASPNLPPTKDTEQLRGGSLGLGLVDGDQNLLEIDYQFVAVEFDTFKNKWDPDGTHVGININDMKSKILEKWWTNITQGEVCNCSVVYSSRNNVLEVYFTEYKLGGGNVTQVILQYLSYHVNIIDQLPKSVIVGISAATGDYSEEHTLLSWSFSTSTIPPSKVDPSKGSKLVIHTILLVGIGIGTGLFLSLSGLVYLLLWRMRKRKEGHISEATSHL